ncbi:sugar phosphate isomerase/epimerase family protein [Streptomyces sp. BR1]|uniref:sugar phosphate isomerase/epimerase family protein n=1 Tax=Streptomyces sp. BR1 TaxID=1592323 RepID=UPI00402B2B23
MGKPPTGIPENVPGASVSPRFGFGAAGLADHRLPDALSVLADLGYDVVTLAVGHWPIDPWADELRREVELLSHRLDRLGLGVVITTASRYLLDSWHADVPSLLSGEHGRERRVRLLLRAVRIAADLDAGAVVFRCGTAPAGMPARTAWQRLTEGCSRVLEAAEHDDVMLALELSPGMFIRTCGDFEDLAGRLGHPDRLGLALDDSGDQPSADTVRRVLPSLTQITLAGPPVPPGQLSLGTRLAPVLPVLRESPRRIVVSIGSAEHGALTPQYAKRALAGLRSAFDTTCSADGIGR